MKTNEDLEREREDMEGAFKYMDSEEGKKFQEDIDRMVQKNQELEKTDELLYPITKRMVQKFAIEQVGREFNDDEIHGVLGKICWQIDGLLKEAVEEVDTMTKLWEKAIPVESVKQYNSRFEVHAKNELAYESEFSLICAYISENDACEYAREYYIYPAEEYKIEKVEGGVRQIIVHHKNPLNGGDGFHMDVHEEPKSVLNHHDQNF